MTSLKYNAISCDACRVFFRRVVKDSDSAVDYQLPECKCGEVRNPLCQTCRFEKCLNVGMKREYVSGTSFYQDHRTIASVDSQFGLTYVKINFFLVPSDFLCDPTNSQITSHNGQMSPTTN